MPCVLGITGGIASGKSIFTTHLLRHYPAKTFDSDVAARELLEQDSCVQAELYKVFPEAVVDGRADRQKLRHIVFSDPAKRRALESILHPRIRSQWIKLAEDSRALGDSVFINIPLLFETEAEKYFDATVLVGSTETTQIRRLESHRSLKRELAKAIIASQMGLSKKISRADHLIWNESSMEHLELQAKVFAAYLKQRYG